MLLIIYTKNPEEQTLFWIVFNQQTFPLCCNHVALCLVLGMLLRAQVALLGSFIQWLRSGFTTFTVVEDLKVKNSVYTESLTVLPDVRFQVGLILSAVAQDLPLIQEEKLVQTGPHSLARRSQTLNGQMLRRKLLSWYKSHPKPPFWENSARDFRRQDLLAPSLLSFLIFQGTRKPASPQPSISFLAKVFSLAFSSHLLLRRLHTRVP